MKKIIIYLLLTCGIKAFAQENIARYIVLDVRYHEEDGQRYLGVSPELRTSSNDPIGRGLARYPRRFRYLLLNKTRFLNRYERYYPDTARINRLYTDSLQMDRQFTAWFTQLTSPFSGKDYQKQHFTRRELLQVASRFFYCQAIRPDSSIASTICIGRNGLDGLPVTRDRSLLEAFCFEAIFERYYSKPGIRSQFIENFLGYINEAVSSIKPTVKDKSQYLLKIREFCFRRMEDDKDLEAALLEYYKEHVKSLPFVID